MISKTLNKQQTLSANTGVNQHKGLVITNNKNGDLFRIKPFFEWVNPKNWFSSIANIEINLNEFTCKKYCLKNNS